MSTIKSAPRDPQMSIGDAAEIQLEMKDESTKKNIIDDESTELLREETPDTKSIGKIIEPVDYIKKHTKRARIARISSVCLLILLMIFGVLGYTSRYLNSEENISINTERKKIHTVSLPVILIKGALTPSYIHVNNNIFNLTVNLINKVPEIEYIDTDEFTTLQYGYTTIIIPPKNEYMNVGTQDYLTLSLYISQDLKLNENRTQFEDYIKMQAMALDYTSWIWVYHRKDFINNINDIIYDNGLNAHLMITPLNTYDTALEVEIKKNKITSKRTTTYDISFNGMAGSYDHISYTNDSIIYNSIIWFNAPIDGRVLKDVISKKYDIFDIFSSIGGLYSIGSLILTYIFGCIIYGTGVKCIDNLGEKFQIFNLCPYAEYSDHIHQKQTQNEATIMFKQCVSDNLNEKYKQNSECLETLENCCNQIIR